MAAIVVAGALANKPGNGGEAWVRLSWVRGLQQLGHDITFVEQIADDQCVDASGRPAPRAASTAAAWFAAVTAAFGLRDAALVGPRSTLDDGLAARLAAADLLVNISGNLDREDVLSAVRVRAYVDIDPGFTQFWHAQGALADVLARHDLHFTIGESIGEPGCPVPTAGVAWQPVRQPVVLADWPEQQGPGNGRFTTVANWRGPAGPVSAGGRTFGLKVHEFRKLMDLPGRAPVPFEVALAICPLDDGDRRALVDAGWQLADPVAAAGTPGRFRDYVQGSAAEFSVAQGMYVDTRCGWFSDRTVRYLASGRPALVQDTGFGKRLPVGVGLLTFTDLEQAADGAARIRAEHARHARAARSVAEQHFAAEVVLPPFLRACGLAA